MLSIAGRNKKEAMAMISKAMQSGDKKQIKDAWEMFHDSVAETIKQDYQEAQGNRAILAQRGYRQLTTEETKYYEALIKAGRSENPKQELAGLLSGDVMPVTIIEDVYKDLVDDHPLLSKINFQNVAYLTRWILNDHTKQTAVWGEINSEITKEITSAFKVVEVNQCKLTAFALIEKDMLDLGPVFLDNYIRTFLKDALLCGLEKAIISGSGKNCPIGLNRDIHEGVSVSSTDGYPEKAAIAVTSFLPEEYGELVARLVESEKGNQRKFEKVLLICNMKDYLTKVMPATTVLTSNGTYAKDLFPFPTDVEVSNELVEGKAILCLPEEYFMGIGGAKEGVIEYSDEVKFLEDKRAFKIKMYGMGKAYDNTVSIVLDITNLDPAYITVLSKSAIPSA
nr:MAG TPA: major capsid protein [Caudoviricetes sp.]